VPLTVLPQESVARTWQVRNAYKISIGKSERKKPFGGHRCRWKDNITELAYSLEYTDILHATSRRLLLHSNRGHCCVAM
jgi:hypothetical protein